MSSFWSDVSKQTLKEFCLSCERGDSFEKRKMYVSRLDGVLANMAANGLAVVNGQVKKGDK
jgi:hypothetical protein